MIKRYLAPNVSIITETLGVKVRFKIHRSYFEIGETDYSFYVRHILKF